jgi:hypothetical protein
MRTGRIVSAGCLIASLCLSVSIAESAPFTPQVVTDPYPGITWPNSNFDVIGAREGFDIESITLTQFDNAAVSLKIRFNYSKPEDYGHAGNYALTSLADYYDFGIRMSVGDLLFAPKTPNLPPGVPPYPGHVYPPYVYGVALVDHDGFNAGDLYRISSTLDSNFYLDPYDPNHSRFIWNFGAPVRMNFTGSQHLTDGTAVTTAVGGPEVETTITFAQDPGFNADWGNFNLLVHFASAICANDEINGLIGPPPPDTTRVPAPASFGLLLAGVAGLAILRRRRGAQVRSLSGAA